MIVISAKRKRGEQRREYQFVNLVRHLAKAALILLLAFNVPRSVAVAKELWTPLPSTIYGLLLDTRTGEPIDNARIRAITEAGIDIADRKQTDDSDSRGFYVVVTTRQARRTARLLVSRLNCRTDTLSLRHVDWNGTGYGATYHATKGI